MINVCPGRSETLSEGGSILTECKESVVLSLEQ